MRKFREFFESTPALKDNEESANKSLILACAISAVVMAVIFVLYITKAFALKDYTSIYIFMPINIVIMLSPLLIYKKFIKAPWFKYMLLALVFHVVITLNIIIPKHGVLAWALPILLVNHYYNRKLGLITYLATIVMMLVCIYLGALFGEYDPGLLGNGIIVDGKIVEPLSAAERIQMMNDMIVNNGQNRYLRIFGFYYFPRSLIISVLFSVSQSLNRRTHNLLENERNYLAKNEKIENELQIASQIQESALPKGDFANAQVAIHASIVPARQIGGDFYDYYFLDRHHLVFLIGDVSGKGAPSALFMMKAITCFKGAASLDKTPLETMQEVNDSLLKGNEEGAMFVTAFFGILDTRNGEVHFVNAGHCPPLIKRYGKFEYLNCPSGFVLGAMKNPPLKEETLRLEPGAMLALYTDGITEARGPQGLYGKKRLLEVMNRFEYRSINSLVREVVDDIGTWVAKMEQSDDLTALVLHYMYEDIHWDELLMPCTKEGVDKAIDFIVSNVEQDVTNRPFKKSIAVVIDEIYSNISKYAYPKGDVGDVYIRYCYYRNNNLLQITFIDRGVAYDPTKHELPTGPSLDHEGGLGLLIVNNIMDDVDYDRRNNKNFLVLSKTIQ